MHRTAQSVWRYKAEGHLMLLGEQSIVLATADIDPLIRSGDSDALMLLTCLEKAHWQRGRSFAVSPAAMEQHHVIGPWGKRRYRHALRTLCQTGLLEQVKAGGRMKGELGAVSLSDEAALGGQIDPQYNLHVLPRLRPPCQRGGSVLKGTFARSLTVAGIGCDGASCRDSSATPMRRAAAGSGRHLSDTSTRLARFDLAAIEFTRDGGIDKPGGDHVGNRFPQIFGALVRAAVTAAKRPNCLVQRGGGPPRHSGCPGSRPARRVVCGPRRGRPGCAGRSFRVRAGRSPP